MPHICLLPSFTTELQANDRPGCDHGSSDIDIARGVRSEQNQAADHARSCDTPCNAGVNLIGHAYGLQLLLIRYGIKPFLGVDKQGDCKDKGKE